jgi:hypothetical protein
MNWIRKTAAPRTQAKARRPSGALEREREVRVMSYYRAHQESVRHRVLGWRDPLAPDTDRYHRRIREKLVDCRTDGCAGRDEKDVGVVRSCSCGVAEKKSAA